MRDASPEPWATIVNSSIWLEPLHVKIAWVTLLALADRKGYVRASLPGIAHLAGITIPQCREALDKFLAPDPHSRSVEHEGRRIEEADGKWLVLNYEKLMAPLKMQERRRQSREAQRRYRTRHAETKRGKHSDRAL